MKIGVMLYLDYLLKLEEKNVQNFVNSIEEKRVIFTIIIIHMNNDIIKIKLTVEINYVTLHTFHNIST